MAEKATTPPKEQRIIERIDIGAIRDLIRLAREEHVAEIQAGSITIKLLPSSWIVPEEKTAPAPTHIDRVAEKLATRKKLAAEEANPRHTLNGRDIDEKVLFASGARDPAAVEVMLQPQWTPGPRTGGGNR